MRFARSSASLTNEREFQSHLLLAAFFRCSDKLGPSEIYDEVGHTKASASLLVYTVKKRGISNTPC